MLRIKHTLLYLVACLTFFRVLASDIEFRTLSVNEGLSQSTVLAIAQDLQGRIWMGTQDGLNCYDGYAFTVFRHVEGNAQSLGDNSVSALFAEGGRLWIGTASGLSCYDTATQSFENFRLEGRSMQVSDIAPTADGSLLLATDLGIVLFDKQRRALEIRTYLTGISVHAVCPSRDGFLVGTSSGVYTYSSTYGNITRILPQMARYDIASIVTDGEGYWVATHGNGLYRLDGALQVTASYTAAANPGLASDYIRVLKTDASGRLWVGTFDGLSIRDPHSGRFERYVHNSEPGSLSHNSIRAIFIDAQHGVWLGTYYGGVNYYHPLARRFGVLRYDPSRNSLGDNTVSSIVEDPSSENLWIGTNDDGVNLYDRRTGRFAEFNTSNGMLLSNNVKCILPDGRGRVWIGTHAGGLSSMDAASRRMRHYPVNASIPINNSCYALLDGGDGSLWVGTLNGLLSFDIASGSFSRHLCAEYEPRLGSLQITTLFRDSKRRVWIGTGAGLYVFLPESRQVMTCELAPVKEGITPPGILPSCASPKTRTVISGLVRATDSTALTPRTTPSRAFRWPTDCPTTLFTASWKTNWPGCGFLPTRDWSASTRRRTRSVTIRCATASPTTSSILTPIAGAATGCSGSAVSAASPGFGPTIWWTIPLHPKRRLRAST